MVARPNAFICLEITKLPNVHSDFWCPGVLNFVEKSTDFSSKFNLIYNTIYLYQLQICMMMKCITM